MNLRHVNLVVVASMAILVCCVKSGIAQEDFCAVPATGEVFCDDFQDRNINDRMPVTWFAGIGGANAQLDPSSGDLVVGSTNGTVPIATSGLLENLESTSNLTDTSLRTQFRLNRGGGAIGFVRFRGGASPRYFGYLNADGQAGLGGNNIEIDSTLLAQTELRPMEEDIVMQLDAIGTTIDLRFWRPSETMPKDPLLSLTNDVAVAGGVSIGSFDSDASPRSSEAVFRYAHVATSPIPEPTAGLLCGLGLIGLLGWRRKKPSVA